MKETLIVNPIILEQNGNKIIKQSEDLNTYFKNIYSSIENMLNKDYITTESLELINKLNTYKEETQKIVNTVNNYGLFLVETSNIIREENIEF